jgi:ADP-ribosylglycohydrolase
LDHEGRAEFTDDTQMMLFTVEGLLLARQNRQDDPSGSLYRAYLRWLRTQRALPPGLTAAMGSEGGLLSVQELWQTHAPGGTCLSALSSGRMGTTSRPINNSKGCGGVMRAAPIGLVYSGETAFAHGCASAAITHGHPAGYLTAGVLAQITAELVARDAASRARDPRGALEAAVQASLATLRRWPNHTGTLEAIERALLAVDELPANAETVESLGGGWIGEEALSIALFCALAHTDAFNAGVLLAVNHSGDSDSTGTITGNLLGTLLGVEAIPPTWIERIQLRGEIERLARSLVEAG